MKQVNPIFKSLFGSTWDILPPVFHKRYGNRPFCNEIIVVQGNMNIKYSKPMSWLMPIFRLLHILAPYQGNNIPVIVYFRSQIDCDAVYLERNFYFPRRKAYKFNSSMHIINSNDVIERMAGGLGWRTNYFYARGKIIMHHKSYVWRLFGIDIPMPLEILVGKGHAEEEAIDDYTYRITMTMTHALFGNIYSYCGNFTINNPKSTTQDFKSN